MAQDEDLDLFGGVGAGVEHQPAQQLLEHLIDQLQRHRWIMPVRLRLRTVRSTVTCRVSGTLSTNLAELDPGHPSVQRSRSRCRRPYPAEVGRPDPGLERAGIE